MNNVLESRVTAPVTASVGVMKMNIVPFYPKDKKLTLEIRNQDTGRIRYEFKPLQQKVCKSQIQALIAGYKTSNDHLLHVFDGSTCLIMKFFVELDDDEVDTE